MAAKLFGTSVLAQTAVIVAIGLAAARTTPADFALFGSISAAAAILASVNTLAAETRSPVVGEGQSVPLTRAGLATAALSLVMCLTVAGVGLAVNQSWSVPVMLAGVCSLMVAGQQLLAGVVMRLEHQELLARSRLVQGLFNAGLIILLIFRTNFPAYLSLVLAWLLSLFLGNASVWISLPANERSLGRFRFEDLRFLIREVRFVPFANLMATTSSQLPVLALQASGASAITGAWALVYRFLTPVVNTSFNTLQPFYYGRAAALVREGKIDELSSFHRLWSLRLSLASVVAFIAFGVVVWWGIPWLGPHWDVARLVLIPACLHFTTMFLCLPLSQTLLLLGNVDTQFTWTASRFALCSAPLTAMLVVDPMPALHAWAVLSCLTYLALIVLQRRALRGARVRAT